jgi:hypothetical protein
MGPLHNNSDDKPYPLYCSVEMACNLVYLARHTEANFTEQRLYLDQALQVLFDMSHNPKLYG